MRELEPSDYDEVGHFFTKEFCLLFSIFNFSRLCLPPFSSLTIILLTLFPSVISFKSTLTGTLILIFTGGSVLHEGVLTHWRRRQVWEASGDEETKHLQQKLEGQQNVYKTYFLWHWFIWWWCFYHNIVQVSNCGKSGCKEEPLAAEEEKRVFFYRLSIICHTFLKDKYFICFTYY